MSKSRSSGKPSTQGPTQRRRSATPGSGGVPGSGIITVGGDPPPVGTGPGGGGTGTPDPGNGGTGDSVPRPAPTRRTHRKPTEIRRQESAAGKDKDIPLGRCLQGLKKLYENAWSNGRYYFAVAALGEGPIRSATPRADGKAIPLFSGSQTNPQATRYRSSNGAVNVWVYDGSQASGFQETASGLFGFDPDGFNMTASPEVIAAWEFQAFAVVRVEFVLGSQDTIPEFTFAMEGYRDLYDPLDGTRKYSENRALWIREVLTNTRWGLKAAATQIDDNTFLEARNDCAAAVFPAQPLAAGVAAVTATAGNPSGSFSYTYTRVNANGVETLESPASNTVSPAAKQVTLTIPVGDALTAKFRVYRSQTGPDATTRRRIGELIGNAGGVFTDNVSAGTWATGAKAKTVAPTGPGRYEGGGRLLSARALGRDWLNTLRASCAGVITVNNGRFQLQINKALPPGYVPRVYTEVHGGGGLAKPNVESRGSSWGRKRRHELPNEVEVKGVDWQNDYAPISVVKSRPSVLAGLELPRRATYEIDDAPDTAYCGRLATTLLNLFWDDAYFNLPVDRSGIATLPWDVISYTGQGLVNQLIRVRQVQTRGEGFWLRGTEYQAGSFSDQVLAEDAPVSAGSTGLSAALAVPENIAAASVVWQEELYQPATGGGAWATRGVITIAFPAATGTGIESVDVWLSVNGGTSRPWLRMTQTTQVTPPLFEVGTYTLTFYTVSTMQRRSSGVSKAVPVVGVTGIPPEPCELVMSSLLVSPVSLSFEAARVRSEVLWGAASWSAGAAVTGFTAANVNNGVLNVAAFTAPQSFNRLYANDTLPFPATPSSEIMTGFDKVVVLDATWSQKTLQIKSTTGAKRYWRLNFGDFDATRSVTLDAGTAKAFREVRVTYQTATPTVIGEVQFIEWGAVDPQVTHYLIYDTSVTPNLRVGQPIPAAALPTAANPLNIESLVSRVAPTFNVNGSVGISLRVAAVSASGSESTGFACGLFAVAGAAGVAADFIPQMSGNITCVNGANGIVTPPLGIGHAYVSGPSAAFSIAGVDDAQNGANGVTFPLTNDTTQTMTLLHDSGVAGGGTAAEGFYIPSGFPLLVPPRATVWVTRATLATGQRWYVHEVSMGPVGSTNAISYADDILGGAELATITAPAKGTSYNRTTTTSATFVTAASVSGRGVLQFLAVGSNAATGVTNIRLTVDGVVLVNDISFSGLTGGPINTALAAIVGGCGSIGSARDGTDFTLWPIPTGRIEFKTSLLIEFRRNTGTTSYIGWIYETFA